jgi:hypothetical protein
MGTVLARVPSLTTSRSQSEPTAFVFSTFTAVGSTSGLTSVPSFLIRMAYGVAMEMDSPRSLRRAADLKAQDVRKLVRAAIAQTERPEGKLGKPCVVYAGLKATKTGSNQSRRRT